MDSCRACLKEYKVRVILRAGQTRVKVACVFCGVTEWRDAESFQRSQTNNETR